MLVDTYHHRAGTLESFPVCALQSILAPRKTQCVLAVTVADVLSC